MSAPDTQPPYSTSRRTVSGCAAAHATATSAPIDVPIRSKGSGPSVCGDRGELLQLERQRRRPIGCRGQPASGTVVPHEPAAVARLS